MAKQPKEPMSREERAKRISEGLRLAWARKKQVLADLKRAREVSAAIRNAKNGDIKFDFNKGGTEP